MRGHRGLKGDHRDSGDETGASRALRPTSVRLHRVPVVAWLLLIGLVLVGGALRACAAADPYLSHRSSDEYDYERIALGLYESGTYGRGSTLQRAPGAPVMFALANIAAPTSSTSATVPRRMDIPAAYWAQAVVGTALIPVAWLLALVLGGVWSAVAAAPLAAVYPPFVRGAGELLSEPLGTLLLTSAILLVVVATMRPGLGNWAFAGFMLGLANLTRPDFIFLPLVIAAVVFVNDRWCARREPSRARVRPWLLVAFIAASALTVAPWSAYATAHAGHLVTITTGDGAALYIGTSPVGGGTSTGLRRAYGAEVRRRFDRPVVHLQDVFRIVAPTSSLKGQDSVLRRKALENLWYDIKRPRLFVPMTARKQRQVWWNSSNPGQSPRPWWMVPLHRIVLIGSVLAAAAGLFALRGRARLLLAIAAVPVAYVAILHIAMPAEPRFNVPVMPVLIACGAAGAAALARRSVDVRATRAHSGF